MTIDPQPIAIELTPRFQRDLRTLGKRYRNIRNDIQPVIEQLQAGELPGDRIPGMEYEIFKVRIKNSDIQKGKSAGYRAIYYLKTSDSIVLVTIYSKSDLSDIAAETGYSIEFFNSLGNTVVVATLPGSYLRSPTSADRPTVRLVNSFAA